MSSEAYGAAHSGRLLVSCPDRRGIVAAVSRFLFELGANIVTSDQYSSDPEGGAFFMRMTFQIEAADERREELEAGFRAVAEQMQMQWRVWWASDVRKVAIMVSREDHCLSDLLWRVRRGDLAMEVVAVISNHDALREEVERLGIAYHHVPVPKDGKQAAEQRVLDLLTGRIDLLVLARYMQILSGDFLTRIGAPAINIHHSFLPAFAGADPYRRAHERGVKLIGATAHYATEELDAGPIIEQDVLRVNHRYTRADLARVGRDVERLVLARAVRSHLDDRVLVDGARTVVF